MKKIISTKAMALLACTLACVLAASANAPFLTRVYDYVPAPGQFVNTMPVYNAGEPKDSVIARAQRAICGSYEVDDWGDSAMVYKPGMISLGGYGGYVVVGFDHPVVNVKGQCDFQIFGNAFQADQSSLRGGSSEPGIVMVSRDDNGDGLPNDDWYELAGSEYNAPGTQHGYRIVYYKPSEDKTRTPSKSNQFLNDTTYVRWTSNDVNPDSVEGYLSRNTFHNQSYWPGWITADTLAFTGTKLPCNAINQGTASQPYFVQVAFGWGYVDNYVDFDPYGNTADTLKYQGANMGFNIDWAVDSLGHSVQLDRVDFIKVYCAVNQYCGWLGETSTEVAGGLDLHPQAAGVQAVNSNKTVQAVAYYNLQGMRSQRPFSGVNIVVTRYGDGSTSTAKQLFK